LVNTYIYNEIGKYITTIEDIYDENEIVFINDENSEVLLGAKSRKYGYVKNNIRKPDVAIARYTKETAKILKAKWTKVNEKAGILYIDTTTKILKVWECEECMGNVNTSDLTNMFGKKLVTNIEVTDYNNFLGPTEINDGSIFATWHTHPDNDFKGSDPSEPDLNNAKKLYLSKKFYKSFSESSCGVGFIVTDYFSTVFKHRISDAVLDMNAFGINGQFGRFTHADLELIYLEQ